MNDDALAAVAAAVQLLYGGTQAKDLAPAACWTIAGRVRTPDAERIRRIARFHSRWAMMGRLQ
jgi:hypothetical protein